MIKNKIKEIVGVISSLDDELSMLYLDFAKKIQQFLSNNFHIIESMNVISVS